MGAAFGFKISFRQYPMETLKQFDELRAELKRRKYFLYAMIVLLIWLLISL